MAFLHALLHFDEYLAAGQHGPAVYLVLVTIVFCETALLALFFLPGDPLLFVSGALCATGVIDLSLLMPLLIGAAVSGSAVNYALGRALGRSLLAKKPRWLNPAALDRTRTFYERYGAVTLMVSPFIAVVRTFAPFVAGMAGMRARRFFVFTVAGDLLWVGVLVPCGYFFGNIPLVRDHLNTVVLSGLALGAAALLVNTLLKFTKTRVRS